jgi:hypothetical protein
MLKYFILLGAVVIGIGWWIARQQQRHRLLIDRFKRPQLAIQRYPHPLRYNIPNSEPPQNGMSP